MPLFSHRLPAVVVCCLWSCATASAAPDAGAKARGDYSFYGHSAHTTFSSARGHVEAYQAYLGQTHGVAVPPVGTPAPALAAPDVQIATHGAVDPEIAREASDAIADDIERIQRHVTRMKSRAKSVGDTDAIAMLDDVEKQLAVARRGHAALHEHHAGDSIAPATAMSLAQKVNEALRAAHAEHDEVMRRLGQNSVR
jgi:hypothetical protein